MPGLPIFLIPIVLGLFDLQVNWTSHNHDAVNVVIGGQDEFINECLQNGLQVSYRFKTRLCRRRSLWFDDCENDRVDTHAIQYDPISQVYEIITDTHHDVEGPKRSSYPERGSALAVAASKKGIPISKLPRKRSEPIDPYRYYMGVRTITECKGEGRFLAQIPLLLSLGLFNPSISDSGWLAFDLKSGTIISP